MGLFTGKRGIILGVANKNSLAWAVAEAVHGEGAELGFNHLPDQSERRRNEKRAREVAETTGAKLISPCDLQSDEDIARFFQEVKDTYGTIDFLVHSVAYAPLEDIQGPTLAASRNGFKIGMDVSVYSLIAAARAASELMPNGGSIVAMTYFGGEKVVGGYNLMGVCKAALDQTVRYLAYDLGPKNIRVNAISAGPVRTLAASAVGEFKDMMRLYEAVAPLGRNITPREVGQTGAFLLSDMATATTGEILHVDCGYNIMGSPGHALERLGVKL